MSSKTKKKSVICDWDGALIETTEIILGIHQASNPNRTLKDLQDVSTGNWWEKHEGAGFTPVKDFEKSYKEQLFALEISADILEVLENLHQQYSLSIVSSNYGRIISEYLKAKRLSHYFPQILGSEHHKSKVVKISNLLMENNHEPHDAVFITDTSGDVHEAREAGVKSIAVTWGLHSNFHLVPARPEYIIRKPHKIPHLVKILLNKDS